MNSSPSELEQLQQENQRLRTLLKQHGIVDLQQPEQQTTQSQVTNAQDHITKQATLSDQKKISLFRNLFQGREDLYPLRWEKRDGASGYTPACSNDWKPGICGKKAAPRIKCGECTQRAFLPLTDKVIRHHLQGKITIGIYPLLPTEQCHFLAIDFDKRGWREDIQAVASSCRQFQIPAAIEISRSGNGGHLWIFFTAPTPAIEARQLGAALISHTCAHQRQLELASYDRMFPNQERMPKGGFGNLIALPLQGDPRKLGRSIFVNDQLQPWPDQWEYLHALQQMDAIMVATAIQQLSRGGHVLDVAFIEEENQSTPWKRPTAPTHKIPGTLPKTVIITLANQIYFEKGGLTQPLTNRLIRLAAFQNPEYYKAQQMRFSVWDKPRIIGCAENYPKYIALPRGCLDEVNRLLQENGVQTHQTDERFSGTPINYNFNGTLRNDQQQAVDAMLAKETGVLCAPTAFGKTVTAAAIIAARRVNTLIIVNRTDLLQQWMAQLHLFLELDSADPDSTTIGQFGGGRRNPPLKIDVAVMQSLVRKGEVNEIVEQYGQVVVDECHHLSSISFEALLKQARARYVLGLTATPERRDGHHPIIFMQCGPIRHRAQSPATAPHILQVLPRTIDTPPSLNPTDKIQEIFRDLVENHNRNQQIRKDAQHAYQQGRKVLLLTERTDHLKALHQLLTGTVDHLFLLHGRLSRKKRTLVKQALKQLPPDQPRILLATGRLIGEGFDPPPLDTLILAMPVSWKGTLQQYAGRLHRDHSNKHDVLIYDYLDSTSPPLMKMWERRQKGYRMMGYQILSEQDLLQI